MNQVLTKTSTILKQTNDFLVIRHKDNYLEFYFFENSNRKFIKCFDLSNKIKQLPSEELKILAYSSDLHKEWEYERRFSRDIAFCFVVKIFGLNYELLEEVITDKLMLLLIEAIVGRYETLRDLLKTSFSILKKHYLECPKTPDELLLNIIIEERNTPFETKITHNFIQYEPSQLAKFYNELAKKDINIDQNKLEKLKPIHVKADKLTPVVTCIFDCLAANYDRTPKHQRLKIKHLVNRYNESVRYIDEIMAEQFCGRTSQGRVIPTVTWNCGEVSYSDAGRNQRKPKGFR